MILALGFEFVRYHFLALDFIPNDMNDKGKVVGDIRTRRTNRLEAQPVLLVDGREVTLGDYAKTGSALSINNRDHVLIECDAKALKASKRLEFKGVETGLFKDKACYFWANGKATYVGSYYMVHRMNGNDRFLASQFDLPAHPKQEIVAVKNRHVTRSTVATVPPRGKEFRANTGFTDMNERGTLVGYTDFGYSLTHAIAVEPNQKVIDLSPRVEMHTGWSAGFINSTGDILGVHYFDSSIGGHSLALWSHGVLREISTGFPSALNGEATSFNDLDQIVGVKAIYDSGMEIGRMQKLEAMPPYSAVPMSHAVVWIHDKMVDLNGLTDAPKDCVLERATKINNRGWIIGTAVVGQKRVGFLLKPILE